MRIPNIIFLSLTLLSWAHQVTANVTADKPEEIRNIARNVACINISEYRNSIKDRETDPYATSQWRLYNLFVGYVYSKKPHIVSALDAHIHQYLLTGKEPEYEGCSYAFRGLREQLVQKDLL